jgi:transposase-like protein
MARPNKLTPAVRKIIVDHVKIGATVEDACALAGITETTFYNWMQAGRNSDSGVRFEFFEAVTRARKEASVAAIITLRRSFSNEAKTVTRKREQFTEIRLRTVKNPETGVVEQVPYEYSKTTVTDIETAAPPDWRAAIEYLKRRDSANWSEKHRIEIEHVEDAIIDAIHNDEVTYDAMVKAYGNQELVDDLFRRANNIARLPAQVPASEGIDSESSGRQHRES